MTSLSSPQPQDEEEEHLQTIPNPNLPQHDENPNQLHSLCQSPSSQIETLETPNLQNPEKSDTDQPQNHPKSENLQNPEKSEIDQPQNHPESENLQNPEKSEIDQPQNQPKSEPHQEEQEETSQVADQIEDQQNQNQDQEQEDLTEQSGMSLSLPPPDTLINISDLNPLPLVSPSHPPRRFNKRKKFNVKKQQAIVKKVQTLIEKLKPIPFVPSKTLDFPKHEKLLRRLGLWDFVHIEFDRNISIDLLAQLVVNYDPKLRCSYVNDYRVCVNRADLARALKLHMKKDKASAALSDTVDLDAEVLSEEAISFIEDYVMNWMLLQEDTWIMPSEVLNWIRTIKDGHPEKVDWAALIWFMVEKELMQGQQLEDCYYASHLQYLIKSQREELFIEETTTIVEEAEVNLVKEEDDVGDMKMGDFQGEGNVSLEEDKIELTLGQDVLEKEEEVKDEDMLDVEEGKEEEVEEHGRWLLDGKNDLGEHLLRPCNLEEGTCLDSQEESKQEDQEEMEEEVEEEGEELEDDFNLASHGNDLEENGLTGNFLQGMETTQIPFSLSGQLHTSKAEPHMVSCGPSFFGNGNKREIGHEHDISLHSLDGGNKRLRTDGPWDHKSSDFGMCMDQMQHWMEKARMMHEAKEHAYEESNMNQQFLLSEVQRRDSVIEHLHKAKMEEAQKREGDIFRLERELYAMASLLEGYRKALKETQKSFAEYRQRSQLPEEPLYKDAGPGGVVMSVMELEKQRQKREEEDRLNRLIAERKVKDFEEEWIIKLEVQFEKVVMLETRLMDLANEANLLKELSAKRKVSESQDVVLETDDEEIVKSSTEI